MRRVLFAITLVALGTVSLVGPTTTATAADDTTITLVTHDSFAVSKSVLAAFTKQTASQ